MSKLITKLYPIVWEFYANVFKRDIPCSKEFSYNYQHALDPNAETSMKYVKPCDVEICVVTKKHANLSLAVTYYNATCKKVNLSSHRNIRLPLVNT